MEALLEIPDDEITLDAMQAPFEQEARDPGWVEITRAHYRMSRRLFI